MFFPNTKNLQRTQKVKKDWTRPEDPFSAVGLPLPPGLVNQGSRPRILTGTCQDRRLNKHPCIPPNTGEKICLRPSLSRWQQSMSEPQLVWGRVVFAAGLITLLTVGCGRSLEAQELPLKRALPGTDSIACPEIDPSIQPSPEEIDQATRLGSDADQANMLGDQVRARDLLERATELDPTSAELTYRYGRILESLGETEPAIDQFCRALALGSKLWQGPESRNCRRRPGASF